MRILTKQSVLFFILVCWQVQSQALDNLSIQIEHWATETLHAQNVDISFQLTPQSLTSVIKAKSLVLPAPLNQLTKVELHCEQLKLRNNGLACEKGIANFVHTLLGLQQVLFSIQAETETEQYQLQLSQLALAGGFIDIDMTVEQQAWTTKINGQHIQAAEVTPLVKKWLDEEQLKTLANWQYKAAIDLQAQLSGEGYKLSDVQSQWQMSSLSLSNEAGSMMTDTVSLSLDLALSATYQGWDWNLVTEMKAGQAYAEPVFLDFSEQPLSVLAEGNWDGKSELLQLNALRMEHPALQVTAKAKVKQAQLVDAEIHADMPNLADAYAVWLQPFLLGTAIEKLSIEGQASIQLKGNLNNYTFQLHTDSLSVKDETNRFAINTLQGDFGWSTANDVLESQLAWQGAQLYAIDLGHSALKLSSQNKGLKLVDAIVLPVMDGALHIAQFTLQQTQDQALNWSFSGELKPVSMESLSSALAWSLMHGKLSGVIPNVRYQQNELIVDGALQLNLFDGQTEIRDLRLISPLGTLPQLYANIDVNNLDLELLTQTFDFGRITGRVDGYVHKLRLSNWQPVYFDAVLATDEENPGKRRISQKAVDNLSQVGGGASGVLSRSFLRFFEDFSYKKLGLSCHLRNDVCEMNGVEPAKQGYYIVKGGGALPPWINVVGYTHRVDWSDLVARLKAVSESDGPVIE